MTTTWLTRLVGDIQPQNSQQIIFQIISTFVNLYRLVGMLVVSMGVVIDTSAFAFVITSLLRKRKKQRNNSSS
jgi:hypothetical protein